jgi:hypothetical protein
MPDGQTKPIDYDGMYIPALAGRPSEEMGQRNYQHPLRTAMDFGPTLDHFSEWVIYVSLVLLSWDATLWTKLKGGDECLLFRKIDFDDPESSLAEALRTLLYFSASQVPPLDASSMPTDLPLIASTPAPSALPGAARFIRDAVRA